MSPLTMNVTGHPSSGPSLHRWKQICHPETAIKSTSCSLSDPLIKGRYPVRGLALGSSASSRRPCTILTQVRWHERSGMGNTRTPLLSGPAEVFCEERRLSSSAVPPSLTSQKPKHAPPGRGHEPGPLSLISCLEILSSSSSSSFLSFTGIKNSQAFDFTPACTSRRGDIHS